VRELLVHFRTRTNTENIESALQETLQKFKHQTGLPTHLQIRDTGLPLPPDVQVQVLHVLQEALSNVRKHAQASQVSLEVDKGERRRFTVRDDGRRFDAERRHGESHLGMKIARVALVSSSAQGTSVIRTLPPPGSRQPGRRPVESAKPIRRCVSNRRMNLPTPPRIRLLLIDDHSLFRCGLKALLEQDGRFEVSAEAGDVGDALRQLARSVPDVILLDNHLPGVRGVDAIPALKEAAPSAHLPMLTVNEDAQDLSAALLAGADGYLLKTVGSDRLCEAIVKVLDGDSVVSPEMMTKLVSAFRCRPAADSLAAPLETLPGQREEGGALQSLSPREREILALIARWDINKLIACELDIAETTVKIHVQLILRKPNVSTRGRVGGGYGLGLRRWRQWLRHPILRRGTGSNGRAICALQRCCSITAEARTAIHV
jgi:DNA-binding NarL/FixJ family response regulator